MPTRKAKESLREGLIFLQKRGASWLTALSTSDKVATAPDLSIIVREMGVNRLLCRPGSRNGETVSGYGSRAAWLKRLASGLALKLA